MFLTAAFQQSMIGKTNSECLRGFPQNMQEAAMAKIKLPNKPHRMVIF